MLTSWTPCPTAFLYSILGAQAPPGATHAESLQGTCQKVNVPSDLAAMVSRSGWAPRHPAQLKGASFLVSVGAQWGVKLSRMSSLLSKAHWNMRATSQEAWWQLTSLMEQPLAWQMASMDMQHVAGGKHANGSRSEAC